MLSARVKTIIDEHAKLYSGTMPSNYETINIQRALKQCLEALIDRLEREDCDELIDLSYRVIELNKKLHKAEDYIKILNKEHL